MAYPAGVEFKPTVPTLGLQPINESSTTQVHPLGMVVTAKDTTYGVGEFVYCKGVASTAAGDLCCYDQKNGDTVRAISGGVAGVVGPCGIAMSANVAGQYGWYQISGAGPVKAATVASDAALYLTSTAGQVDDAVVAGDKIEGMASRAATSSGYVTAQLDHPSITGDSTTSGILKLTLSAAAEAAEAIVVTGLVEDVAGVDATAAKQVLVRTLAVTADKGDITVTAGTEKKTVNPATGENISWIETTAAGAFAFSVANDVAEETLVQVSTESGLTQTLKLTFT